LVAGAACCKTLSRLTGKEIQLKWPNDLYFEGHKLGGILCEAQVSGHQAHCAVIGIGINLHLDRKDLPEELKAIAIALEDISAQQWNRAVVASSLLNDLEEWYDKLMEGRWQEIVQWCNQHNVLTGKPVELQSGSVTTRGMVIGLDEDGHLILETESGQQQHFLEGNTTLL